MYALRVMLRNKLDHVLPENVEEAAMFLRFTRNILAAFCGFSNPSLPGIDCNRKAEEFSLFSTHAL